MKPPADRAAGRSTMPELSSVRILATTSSRCPYSSRRADSDSAHQLRDTQLETLCKNVDRVQAWLLRSVFQIVEERIVQPGMLRQINEGPAFFFA